MEVVTDPEFIKSIERNRSGLNAAFELFSSGETRITPSDIFSAFTRVLNPVYKNGLSVSDSVLVSVFKGLLKLVSKKFIGEKRRVPELEKYFYAVAESHSGLVAEHGGVFLIEVFNALLNLNEKKISSVGKWAGSMASLPAGTDMDTFRKAGFLFAWTHGAASARECSAEIIPSLGSDTIKAVFGIENAGTLDLKKISETAGNNPWQNPASDLNSNKEIQPLFRTAGGFRGFGSLFTSLPAVCLIEDTFHVTDGHDVYRLYADYYGVELLRDGSVKPEDIHPGGVINRFIKDRGLTFNKKVYPLPSGWKSNISSIAVNSDTVVWTLKDSYKIYIVGFGN